MRINNRTAEGIHFRQFCYLYKLSDTPIVAAGDDFYIPDAVRDLF